MSRARRLAPAWLLAAALVAWLLARVALPAATQLTYGFSAYYTAARLVREGRPAARLYDDAWFRAQTARLGLAGAEDIFNVNPPPAALLFWPLAGLTPREARALWTAVNLLCLALAWWGLVRLTRAGPVAGALGLALLAVYEPARAELHLGQAYALLLLAAVALLWAYVAGRDGPAGVLLGLMLAVKTAGILLPLLFVAQRRWRALAWTAATVAGAAMLSVPVLGLAAWRTYAGLLLRFGGRPELAVTAYQDLPGLLAHLFRFDAVWNPAPLVAAPLLATALLPPLALGLVALTFWATARPDPRDRHARALGFAAWLTLTLILSPVSEDYHYTVLLAPLAVALAGWRDLRPGWPALVLLVVGVALVAAPLPYKSPALADGARALLAYPKLYGALALWSGTLVTLRRVAPAPARPTATVASGPATGAPARAAR
ncbi:MAG TPA: glycosyltransferase family 87 protein [Thermomicrobiales bacterium]|nr:glycosyltransferase family 87 protein [Thermomicrobiales bacterium]